jgi:hypothetical protein
MLAPRRAVLGLIVAGDHKLAALVVAAADDALSPGQIELGHECE